MHVFLSHYSSVPKLFQGSQWQLAWGSYSSYTWQYYIFEQFVLTAYHLPISKTFNKQIISSFWLCVYFVEDSEEIF